MLFNLDAGTGGLAEFCARYGDSFHRWRDDLGDPRLDGTTAEALGFGIREAMHDRPLADLAAERGALIVFMLQVRQALDASTR